MQEYLFIGKNIKRVDSRDKVTGEAVYSIDMKPRGLLMGKCKRSPHAFARILSIDTSRACRLAGVKAVITARNVTQFQYGEFATDQLPLCDQYAYYFGDEVAAVAAVDEDTAQEALDMIDVEYEVLTPVFDAEQAMMPGAPDVHPELEAIHQNIALKVDFQRGEGEAAFKHADSIFEGRFTTPVMHQGYLQPRDCVAEWKSGRLTLWAVMQSPFRMRYAIARAVGLSESCVRVIPCQVGGGFGNNASRIWPIAALLSKQAARPVKIVLTREEDFISGRPFPAGIAKIRAGFKRDGSLVVIKKELVIDGGAYVGSSRGVTTVAAGRADNIYRAVHNSTSARLVYTNNIPGGALRGYGNQITTFALEAIMDMAANGLGIDPVELRLKNAVQKDDTTINGFILNSCGFSETLKLASEKSGFAIKSRQKTEKNVKLHGIGVASGLHVSGNRTIIPEFEGSSAFVRIDEQGKISVVSGEVDIGQGAETAFAQIAAEGLGADIRDVVVQPVDTDHSPFAKGTFGSRVTVMGGFAVKLAAEDARKQLIQLTAEMLNMDAGKLRMRDSKFFTEDSTKPVVSLRDIASQLILKRSGYPVIGRGDYCVPSSVVEDGAKSQYYGNYSLAYPFLTQIAEVEVDAETGKVTVTDFWTAVDIGKMINPKMCEAQVEGGLLMGIGYALTESYITDRGRMLNCSFADYKIANAAASPRMHTFFIETVDPLTPYGAKSLGEAVSNPTAAAVANAVYNAVGVRINDLPVTPEKVLKALKQRQL